MTKRQLIDEIVTKNQTADPEFLSPFQDEDLRRYLERLEAARQPRLAGDPHRFDKYFAGSAEAKAAKPADDEPAVSTDTDAAERAALLAIAPPAEVAASPESPAAPAAEEASGKGLLFSSEPTVAEEDDSRPEAVTPDDCDADATADETPADKEAAALSAKDQPGEVEADAEESADDSVDDSTDEEQDEVPTTRRESLQARAARPWRTPVAEDETDPREIDLSQDDDTLSDVSAEEESQDDAPAEDSGDSRLAQAVTASTKSAQSGGEEGEGGSESWLL